VIRSVRPSGAELVLGETERVGDGRQVGEAEAHARTAVVPATREPGAALVIGEAVLHHLGDAVLEVRLRIGRGLVDGRLAGGDELGDERIDVDALGLGDLGERVVVLEPGAQLLLREAELLGRHGEVEAGAEEAARTPLVVLDRALLAVGRLGGGRGRVGGGRLRATRARGAEDGAHGGAAGQARCDGHGRSRPPGLAFHRVSWFVEVGRACWANLAIGWQRPGTCRRSVGTTPADLAGGQSGAGAAGGATAGSRMRTVVPSPGAVRSSTRPLWAWVIASTIDRPRPEPPLWRERDGSAR
jgi:hypothetical protein